MNKAVVLLSGGLDSSTTLFFAKQNGHKPYCLIFDYGQRHKRELSSAKKIAKIAGCPFKVVKISLPWKGSSLLNRKIALPDVGSGLDIATLYKAFFSSDNGAGLDALASLLVLTIASEVGSGSERLGAKIMTSPAASDMKLPTRKGKAGIPSKRVNL